MDRFSVTSCNRCTLSIRTHQDYVYTSHSRSADALFFCRPSGCHSNVYHRGEGGGRGEGGRGGGYTTLGGDSLSGGGGGGGGTSCATTPVHVYHGSTYKANFLYYLPLFCVYKALLYRRMAEIHGHGGGVTHPGMAEILGML